MKPLILTAALSLLLTACSAGTPGMSVGIGLGTNIGSHVGLGTSINIPVGLDKNRTTNSGINVIEEQIVTYFDAQGTAANSAVKGGFYRQLIGKRGNEYTVQDFYQDNSSKRTDPYILSRSELLNFRAHPSDGTLTTYAYNGNLMQQQTYRNNRLIKANY